MLLRKSYLLSKKHFSFSFSGRCNRGQSLLCRPCARCSSSRGAEQRSESEIMRLGQQLTGPGPQMSPAGFRTLFLMCSFQKPAFTTLRFKRLETSCVSVNRADRDCFGAFPFCLEEGSPWSDGIWANILWFMRYVSNRFWPRIPCFFPMPKWPFNNRFYSPSLCCYCDSRHRKRKIGSWFISWRPFQHDSQDMSFKNSHQTDI